MNLKRLDIISFIFSALSLIFFFQLLSNGTKPDFINNIPGYIMFICTIGAYVSGIAALRKKYRIPYVLKPSLVIGGFIIGIVPTIVFLSGIFVLILKLLLI